MSAHLARARWLVIAFVVAAFCTASLTAHAQTFSISGTVTLTASQTLPKNRPNACVTVTLTRFNGNTGLTNNTINTDAAGNGTYSFTGSVFSIRIQGVDNSSAQNYTIADAVRAELIEAFDRRPKGIVLSVQ